jgi:hypothetical protein
VDPAGPGPAAPARDLGGPGEFADDDGSVPPEVAEVLGRISTGGAGVRDLVPVLAGHRLLVPLLEVDGDLLEGDDADPCAGQDRAVAAVSMRTDDGTVGLAFTGMASMLAGDPAARPLPVPATRVAAAVLAEGGVGLVVDPAGSGGVRLGRGALARLAQGGAWPEPWADPLVQQAVVAELAPALAAGDVAVRLAEPGGGSEQGSLSESGESTPGASLLVELRFPAGLSADQRTERCAIVARRLGASGMLREVFDGVLAVRSR